MDKKDRLIRRATSLSGLTGIYTFVILSIFPLVFHNFYFDIMIFKYQFFYISTLALLVLALAVFFFGKKREVKQAKRVGILKSVTWTAPDVSMVCFLAVALVSTLLSDYKLESFMGNEGRYTGLFLLLIYGVAFFIVGKCLKFKSLYMDCFLAFAMLACLFGITDYFQLNLLHFKDNMYSYQLNMFMSTLGNVNLYTAYVGMVMAVASILFTTAKSRGKVIFYYVCMVIAFFAILMGLSDNSYLAIGALFAFSPFYLFQNRRGVKRYFIMLATFSVVIYGMDIINKNFAGQVLEMDGILRKMAQFEKLEYLVLILILIAISVCVCDYFLSKRGVSEEVGKWSRILWGILLAAVIAGACYVIYDANIAGNAARYKNYSNYLIFSDDWGTHRWFNWRLGVENYRNLSWVHKIFGSGPETYGIILVNNNLHEMLDGYGEVFDNAHNEYLQIFITMGPLGLLSYLSLLVSSLVMMAKKAFQNPYVAAALFAAVCYGVQAAVNISTPVNTPVMILLLAAGVAGSRKTQS